MNFATHAVDGDIVRRFKQFYGEELEISGPLKQRLVMIAAWQRDLAEVAQAVDWKGDPRLYPFQRVAVAWLSRIRRGILADEQGLGKTVMSLVAAEQAQVFRNLVICNNSKRDDWVEHARAWTSKPVYVLTGDDFSRREEIARWTESGGYLVINYAQMRMYPEEFSRARGFIVDEAHNARNRKTGTFEALRELVAVSTYVYILTATPVVNLTGDLWTLLAMVDRRRFRGYWSFAFRFCEVTDDGYGLKVGGVRDEERDNLQRMISVYVLQRTKE